MRACPLMPGNPYDGHTCWGTGTSCDPERHHTGRRRRGPPGQGRRAGRISIIPACAAASPARYGRWSGDGAVEPPIGYVKADGKLDHNLLKVRW